MPNSEPPEPPIVPAGRNPIHTAVFALLFVVMVFVVPYFVIGGIVGFFMAPVFGTALGGLYRITLPRGPHQPSIAQTAGSSACPSCASMQTDRRRFVDSTQPGWECFACGHQW